MGKARDKIQIFMGKYIFIVERNYNNLVAAELFLPFLEIYIIIAFFIEKDINTIVHLDEWKGANSSDKKYACYGNA